MYGARSGGRLAGFLLTLRHPVHLQLAEDWHDLVLHAGAEPWILPALLRKDLQ